MNPPLRVGLVGAGLISHSHIPHLRRLGATVFVYSEDGAEALVAQYGGIRVGSLEELFEQVDIVDVVAPTYTHFDLVRRALNAGKPVISEKPLARTVTEADELVRLANSAGLSLRPAHVVRYFPEFVVLHDAVADGSLGDLAVLKFSRAGAYPNRTPWFADRQLSGGIILDQMIHDLDIARWVAGEVRLVSAVSFRAGSASDPTEAAHVLLTHESGAISQVTGIWGPQNTAFATSYSVTGTRGSLAHNSAAERAFRADTLTDSTPAGDLPETDPADNPYFLELQDFLTADPTTIRVTAEDGAEAVRIAEAALESLDSGQPVQLAPRGTFH